MVQGKNGANPRRICEYFNTETAKIIRQKTRFGLYSLPYRENGILLKKAYLAADIDFQLHLKQGCNHHPHGLDDPAPVTEFISAIYKFRRSK